MTRRQTRTELEAEIANLQRQLAYREKNDIEGAEIIADALGITEQYTREGGPVEVSFHGLSFKDRLNRNALSDDLTRAAGWFSEDDRQEARKKLGLTSGLEIQRRIHNAVEADRRDYRRSLDRRIEQIETRYREDIEAIIDALELEDYAAGPHDDSPIASAIAAFAALTGGPKELPRHERLVDDAKRALAVRAERELAHEDDLLEERIRNIAHPDHEQNVADLAKQGIPFASFQQDAIATEDTLARAAGSDFGGPQPTGRTFSQEFVLDEDAIKALADAVAKAFKKKGGQK